VRDLTHQHRLRDKLDLLRLELDIACENDYEFVQKRIKREMAWVARELVKVSESKPPDAGSGLEGYR
jgi:hypothetical protein